LAGERKLQSIEAARGLAALSVVAFHSNSAAAIFGGPRFEPFSSGEHGVDFFFVLSGFIIFFVHAADIGRPDQARDYALKRAIRVLPLLWLVVLSFVLIHNLAGAATFSLGQVASSLFLYPSLEIPTPQVVWTLRHEALFYVMFLSFIFSRRLGLWVFGIWTLAALIQLGLSAAGRPVCGVASFFLSSYELDFVLGGLIATAHRKWTFPTSAWPLLAALAAMVGVLACEEAFGIGRNGLTDYVSLAATAWTLVLGLVFAAVLHGVLCLGPDLKVPRLLTLLGAASYAIYLIHTPVNSATQSLVAHLPHPFKALGLGHVAVIVIGVAAGIATHILVERKITLALRKSLLPRAA
jgi:exopolysaccharide production protein ExoZ